MGNALGTKAKAAFRLGSDAGIINGAYPTTEATADTQETVLDGYDQIPLANESITEGRENEVGETLLGTPAVSHHDQVAIMPGGSVELHGFYDGLDQILAAVMGYEHPGTDAAPISPDYTKGTAEIAGTCKGTQDSTHLNDTTSTPFSAGDVGKFIQLYGANSAAGQIRRITAYVNTGSVTIGTAWDVTPTADSTTYRVSQEFQHFYELSKQLQDELWTSEYAAYPTTGVGGATDKIIRHGTLGFQKYATKPWVWRGCYINSITFNFSARSGMTISLDVVPFNLERDSATNATTTGWGFSESALFSPAENERILFNHLSGSGYLRIGEFGEGVMDSTDEYGISDFSITLNNNLKVDDQDANTGDYRVEPARGNHREVTGSFTLPRYASDTFQDWASDQDILMAHIKFAGSTISTIARAFEIFIGSFKLESPAAPISGAEPVKQTYSFRALIPASNPPFITGDTNPTQYQTAPRSELMIRTTNQCGFNFLRDQNKEY